MREPLDRRRLYALIEAIGRSVPSGEESRVYIIGGATAVDHGWRESTIDVNFSVSDERPLAHLQKIKEELNINVELARPEDFVPALSGSEDRHLFIATAGRVRFFHYDPYSQLLSKIVRGFEQDLADASRFLQDGLVDAGRFETLVRSIPDGAYVRYPNLSRALIESAVEDFLRRALGLGRRTVRWRDLSDLAGRWREAPDFDRAIADQDRVDEELWR